VAFTGAPALAAFDSLGNKRDADPSLTGDGLRLLFVSERNGTPEIFEVTRDSIDAEFGMPSAIPAPPADNGYAGLDVSDDGMRLYFCNFEGDLWTAVRTSFSEPFTQRQQLATRLAVFPSISPDQRELYFNPPGGDKTLWRVVRGSADEAFDFSTAVKLRNEGYDPDLSADGTTMIVGVGGGLSIMQRPCN
jgi:Tol biopolymer transport system component